MHSAIRRVLLYMAVMGACTVIAVFTTETRTGFAIVFGVGFVFGVVAELLFWIHIVRLTLRRRHGGLGSASS